MSINFILPGMYENFDLNIHFLALLKEHPEYFYNDVKVSAVYGSFQFCIFDGGRIFNSYRHTTKEEIENILYQYNEVFEIPVRLVCTNCELKQTDYKNRFGNVILTLCNNLPNEIVVNDSNFKKYIQENYSNFTFISSTTKCLNTPKLLLEELSHPEYKMVCLDYNLNHNKTLLKEMPEEQRGRCEFLCNAICPPGCPNRKQHYSLNSLFSLTYGQNYSIEGCPIEYNTTHPKCFQYKNNISPEEIYNEYVPMGYNLFKLEGRTLSIAENVCNYVRYMVKPEYQFLVINELMQPFTFNPRT